MEDAKTLVDYPEEWDFEFVVDKKKPAMKYLTKEQMEALPTPRLLTYFKKHFRVAPAREDWDKRWEEARDNAKTILATRPHVNNKPKLSSKSKRNR